ncbi:putative O-methyltransferase YrrM [Salinibacter ruber]|uniref:class I SAM-dependent methyltransferase n=1 Tax=Salinibacter ruber TaxID=146919 RepID=UPI002167680D|nr:putative O-methyltransferase YrrM [Salinibacter ruber]
MNLRLARLLQPVLESLVYYRPNVDAALCYLLTQDRLQLPQLSLDRLFDDFEKSTIELSELPRGPWSTPLADVVMLLKIVMCTQPHQMLEVGSYRGYTARLMAQHAPEDAELVTVDMNPDHGEAYRGSALADRIERRVGKIGPDIFESDAPGTYDLIFLDAGHFYDDVKYDTELLLPLLADDGYLLWHDYANWGYFSGKNGVPEYLHELSKSIPIAHIAGSDIAIHCPAWTDQRANPYDNALFSEAGPGDFDPWETTIPRG